MTKKGLAADDLVTGRHPVPCWENQGYPFFRCPWASFGRMLISPYTAKED